VVVLISLYLRFIRSTEGLDIMVDELTNAGLIGLESYVLLEAMLSVGVRLSFLDFLLVKGSMFSSCMLLDTPDSYHENKLLILLLVQLLFGNY